jgi:hypothetical protein
MRAIVILALVALAVAHPTYYPVQNKNETCQQEVPPHIHSYHIHVLFLGNNKNSTGNAMNLREQFVNTFNPNGTCMRSTTKRVRLLTVFRSNIVPPRLPLHV